MRWLKALIRWAVNLFARKAMRRKISLYIANQLVDLDDQSFILFNYTMDDLSNPAIVKNSFSQQITLKGTPQNNKIFGAYFRTDRRVANTGGDAGVDFSASRKTPFVIYNELSEILESGYVKLDSITRKGVDIEYKVTLYGGLGSFFYALSYDANGNKRTLADLDYLGTDNPDAELDFVINAGSVQAAWDRLYGDTSAAEMWDVINFAPAYNGIPEGNFSPDKALIVPSDAGLQDTITQGGVTYSPKSGYALVNLAEAQDEWAVKDLRSYLQRPVFSMKAFWDAICNPANNGGYEVDASVVDDFSMFGQYSALWMTLPLLPSAGSYRRESGDLTLSMTSTASSGNEVGRYDVQGAVPSGTEITSNINLRLRFNMPAGANAYSQLSCVARERVGRNFLVKTSAIFIQVVACTSDDAVVGGSRIKFIGLETNGSRLAQSCGYVPAFAADYERVEGFLFDKVSAGVFEYPAELGFQVVGTDVSYYKVMVSVYPGEGVEDSLHTRYTYAGDGSISTPALYQDYQGGFRPTSTFIVQGATSNNVTYTSSDTLRSGSTITKAMLLSSSHTPAEYMISFCKIFGLYFVFDAATRKVTITRRNDLYQDETIDLTRRVDLSRGMDIRPLVFDKKWYDFSLEGVGGAFYDEYLNVEGIPYGIQRVDTGYDFDSEEVNLMDSVVFKNACSILARSRYFNYIFKQVGQDQVFQPSPFLDKGNTYTLWSPDGETLDTDISCPPASAIIVYYNDNADYKGYDINSARKLELRSADGKPVEGSDVLVFLEGWNYYDYFKLTDDIPAMDVLNDGVPCWMLGAGGAGNDAIRIPTFSRYTYGNGYKIDNSLDFGIPRQFDIPGIIHGDGCTIYERAWKKYMSDRYDENTKVMTCHVNFSGIPVSQALLRKFYWYDNSIWVLNRIINYSLATFDPVECEFVQVQDRDNYLNGQSY